MATWDARWWRRGTMQQRTRDYHGNGARFDIELITCYLYYQDFRFTLCGDGTVLRAGATGLP